jgi:hypothetical protein
MTEYVYVVTCMTKRKFWLISADKEDNESINIPWENLNKIIYIKSSSLKTTYSSQINHKTTLPAQTKRTPIKEIFESIFR